MNDAGDKDETLGPGVDERAEVLAHLVLAVAKTAMKAGDEERYDALLEWNERVENVVGTMGLGTIGGKRVSEYGPLGIATWGWFLDLKGGTIGPAVVGRESFEELVAAFSAVLVYPAEGGDLGLLIAAERGLGRATLPTLVRAGKALVEFRAIDPYFSVTRPGIEAYYQKFLMGEYPVYSESGFPFKGQSVAEGIKKVLQTALG
jgi:hypothetical protein